jgi:PIN domain nuclease of toxin-antitoxin system
VNLLIDTQALLWWLADDRLSQTAQAQITDPENSVAVSAATVWEAEIKRVSGKLDPPEDLLERLESDRIPTIPITAEHGRAAARLPVHHKDPFDRVIVAQAQLEGLTILTADPLVARYQVAVLPAV